jgi:hypothetical protein
MKEAIDEATERHSDLGSLSTIEGPLAIVVSQTMNGYEQASKTELLGDAGLHDDYYATIERSHKELLGRIIDARKLPHHILMWRNQPGEFTHLLIYRSASDGADISQIGYVNGTEHSSQSSLGQVTPSDASQMVRTLEDQLYDQYRAQGDFDAKREEVYRQQGRDRANYTTHFVSYTDSIKTGLRSSFVVENLAPTDATTPITDKTVAHLQIQVSDTLRNPINSENLTAKAGENPLGRKEGERIGDLGRGLNILDPLLSDATKSHLKLAELERPDRFSGLVQNAFSWAIHYAKLDKMVFQVNSVVLEKMKSILGPENVTGIQKPPSGKGNWTEKYYTVILDRAQMERAEERMFAHEMTTQLKTVIERFKETQSLWKTDRFHYVLQPTVLVRIWVIVDSVLEHGGQLKIAS